MKDTPPWWWKLGWTLAEATPKPRPLMTSGNASGNLRDRTAAKAVGILPEKKAGRENEASPKPQGFRPSKTKKDGW